MLCLPTVEKQRQSTSPHPCIVDTWLSAQTAGIVDSCTNTIVCAVLCLCSAALGCAIRCCSTLHLQTEKQRLIWAYKILFIDVLFPLNLRKVIFCDSDQVVRGDMAELWNLDLHVSALQA